MFIIVIFATHFIMRISNKHFDKTSEHYLRDLKLLKNMKLTFRFNGMVLAGSYANRNIIKLVELKSSWRLYFNSFSPYLLHVLQLLVCVTNLKILFSGD